MYSLEGYAHHLMDCYDADVYRSIDGVACSWKIATVLCFEGLTRQIGLLSDKKLIPRPEADDHLVDPAVIGRHLSLVRVLLKARFNANSIYERRYISTNNYKCYIFLEIAKSADSIIR